MVPYYFEKNISIYYLIMIITFLFIKPSIGQTWLTPNQTNDPTKTNKPSTDNSMVFLADRAYYDSSATRVTWSGNVQIWQEGHILRADYVSYDQLTDTVYAWGHVAVLEGKDSIVFTDYIELSNKMREAVISRFYSRLGAFAKLAANGAHRSSDGVSTFSKVVYTPCPICATNFDKPPFWQLRSTTAVHDSKRSRLTFYNTFFDIFGMPLVYFPYFSLPDPSVQRQSGFLIPSINGGPKGLGIFFTFPYYWVLDDYSDVTLTPLIATANGPQLSAYYRRNFTFSTVDIQSGIAYDTRTQSAYYNDFGQYVGTHNDRGIQGYIFAKGQFSIDKTWRGGLNLNYASSDTYMRDYRVPGYGDDALESDVYLEGFGVGAYSHLSAQAYQGLNRGVINNSQLPWVLPSFQYNYFGQPDGMGGRFRFNSQDFFVYRPGGTRSQRAQLQLAWDRPLLNVMGQEWLFTLQLDNAIYHSTNLDQFPNYQASGESFKGQFLPTAAVKMNWPFIRQFGRSGSQIIEPIIQAIVSPNTSNNIDNMLPNEDSFSYEFTDTTLFALNRYTGTDRLDGGVRANIGLHGNWAWNNHQVDFLVGNSYQLHIPRNYPPLSGLSRHYSDIVGKIRISPSGWLDLTARSRVDPATGKVNFGDGLIAIGESWMNVNAGYIWFPRSQYYYFYRPEDRYKPSPLYYRPISELSFGVSSTLQNWHGNVFARQSLERRKPVAMGGTFGYSNDCFGLDMIYLQQYTRIGGERNTTTIMFRLNLKTIGTFGVNG